MLGSFYLEHFTVTIVGLAFLGYNSMTSQETEMIKNTTHFLKNKAVMYPAIQDQKNGKLSTKAVIKIQQQKKMFNQQELHTKMED